MYYSITNSFTLTIFGNIQIQIPMVSGSIVCPTGKTSGWSNALLKMKDLPSRHGPTIDTTLMGSAKGKK